MIAVFGNNCSTTLAAAITSSGQTSVEVVSTTGWPTIGAGEYMELTLNDQATGQVFEVTYVTAFTGTTCTVLRGQEGTVAQNSWAIGDLAYGAVSAGQLNTFLQTALALTAPGAPCGRLTLQQSSGGISYPFPTTNVSNASAIYYTPYGGSLVSVYNGSAWAQYALTELTLTLTSGHNASGAQYDIFLIYASGSLVLVTGPAWTTATARSSAIESTIGGLWTNTTLFTGYNNGTGYSVAANTGLYVGSIYCNGAAEVSMTISPTPTTGGTANILGLYNAYHRAPVTAINIDTTVDWAATVATNAWHIMNASSNNSITFLDGLQQSVISTSLACGIADLAGSNTGLVGVALDSGGIPPIAAGVLDTGAMNGAVAFTAPKFEPQIGLHTVYADQWGTDLTIGNLKFYGGFDTSQNVYTEMFTLTMDM